MRANCQESDLLKKRSVGVVVGVFEMDVERRQENEGDNILEHQ